MGGYGSGSGYRWRGKKATVEDALPLNIFSLQRQGLLKPDWSGSLHWRIVGTNNETGSARWWSKGTGPGTMIYNLEYTLTQNGTKEEVTEPIEVVTTRPYFGGLRQWFVCPLSKDGKPCGRRVGKLYHPSGTKYFGCRHCYKLAYTSSQTHNKRFDFLNRMYKREELGLDEIDAMIAAETALFR